MTTTAPLLSAPKGVKYTCEICGKSAHLQCPQCRLTYYCSKEHQTTDWNGVHVKVCGFLESLRAPVGFLGSSEAREAHTRARLETKRAVIEIGQTEARRNLLAGKFAYAIPGGLQALRLTTDLYGAGGIEVVPPYLLLAQATTGLKKYKQAEEYLSLAKWSVLKNPRCSDALKSQLYRNFGKLYLSQGNSHDALHHFANAVYYSSLAMGPEHIDTTTGYYQMGLIFHAEGRLEAALAMFDKVADVWYKFLSTLVPEKADDDADETWSDDDADNEDLADDDDDDQQQQEDPDKKKRRRRRKRRMVEPDLDELAGTEAGEMLEKIIMIREQHLGITHTATGEAHYILSLILKRLGKVEKALERMQRALAVYEDTLGSEHATTVSVKTALEQLEQQYFEAS